MYVHVVTTMGCYGSDAVVLCCVLHLCVFVQVETILSNTPSLLAIVNLSHSVRQRKAEMLQEPVEVDLPHLHLYCICVVLYDILCDSFRTTVGWEIFAVENV